MKNIVDKMISVDFIDLPNIRLNFHERIGLQVSYEDTVYEFIIHLVEHDDNILVLGSGFSDEIQFKNLKGKPVFARHSWIKDIPHNLIYYNDPTRQDFESLRGGWGIGTTKTWHLQNIAEIIKVLSNIITNYTKEGIPKYSNLYFYGSSMGGFMSIVFATLIENSTAIADSPQINLLKWWYWDELKKNCFKNLTADEIMTYSYKFDLIELMHKEKKIPNVYMILDCTDNRDWDTQYKYFLNHFHSLPYNMNNNENKINIRFDGKSNGHTILSKKETLDFIENIISVQNRISKRYVLSNVENNMLIDFKKQFDILYDNYIDNSLTFSQFIHRIKLFNSNFDYARIDIKNKGNEQNSIEFLGIDDEISVEFPKWYTDKYGVGVKLQSKQKHISFEFKCINDGKIFLNLRGQDYRNLEEQRVPVNLNYKKLVINDNIIFSKNRLTWHDNPYLFITDCNDGDLFKVEVEFETIHDYFPKLGRFIDAMDNDEENLDEKYDALENYINKTIRNYSSPVSSSNEVVVSENIDYKVDKLIKQNKQLSRKTRALSNNFNQLKEQHNEVLDSYNMLFNSIFVGHKLEPRELIGYSHNLCQELLDLVDNICRKHNLQYWLYAGTLLGAKRHGGFIPWDDDCDLNMMREDYDKFFEITSREIEESGLKDNLSIKNDARANNGAFLPFIKVEYRVEGKLVGFVDVMPSDYVTEVIDNAKEEYTNEYYRVRNGLRDGKDRTTLLNEAFDKLKVSKTKTDKIMTGVEDTYKNFAVFDYDDIFPLKSIKFGDEEYPCPNNVDKYLKLTVGSDYMKLPRVVYDHGFHDYLLTQENIYEKLQKHTRILSEFNKTFNMN